MTIRRSARLLGGLALLSLAAEAGAKSPGKAGFAFLNVSPFARSAGMADAASAYVGDAMAVHTNPAGLGHLQAVQAAAHHASHLGEAAYNSVSAAFPLKQGAVAFHVGLLGFQDIPRTRAVDPSVSSDRFVEDGEVKAESGVLAAAWGRRCTKNLALGFGLKAVRETLDAESASTALADAGAIYRFPMHRNWRAAAVLQNVGPPAKFIARDVPAPARFRGGVFWAPRAWSRLSLEGVHNFEGELETRLGAELSWREAAFLRFGYRYDAGRPDLGGAAGFAMGVGVQSSAFAADYAFQFLGDLGGSHRLSVGWKFGRKPGPKRA
ncbi:MAG: PorV/PorQ family protein [Elusimicrobiota bacterium]